MERHARHGNRFAARIAACGEGDVQEPCGLLGIVKKKLVKIAHAVQHQRGGVLGLDGQVLLHHGGVAAEIG